MKNLTTQKPKILRFFRDFKANPNGVSPLKVTQKVCKFAKQRPPPLVCKITQFCNPKGVALPCLFAQFFGQFAGQIPSLNWPNLMKISLQFTTNLPNISHNSSLNKLRQQVGCASFAANNAAYSHRRKPKDSRT